MKVELFEDWLSSQGLLKGTVESRITNCRKIEKSGYDLDYHFNNDNGNYLLSILSYSQKENDNNISPKHNIEIDGNKVEATRTYKSSAKLYFDFCHLLNSRIILDTELETEIEKIKKDNTKTEEEKRILVKYRVGQSKYRDKLIEYWGGCAVTNCDFKDILIASHIKPWSECEPNERCDLYNGLLLSPNYDRLFDRFLISFDEDGLIVISKQLTDKNLEELNISKKAEINKVKLTAEHKMYLKVHRENLK